MKRKLQGRNKEIKNIKVEVDNKPTIFLEKSPEDEKTKKFYKVFDS